MKHDKPVTIPAALFGALAVSLSLGLSACAQDGPVENAGEKIDEAAEDAGDAVEDVVEELDN